MDTLNVNSTVTTVNTKKVTTHSHIKGLGLKEDGYAEPIASGFVGQLKAREVFEEFYNLNFFNRVILINFIGCRLDCRLGEVEKDGR